MAISETFGRSDQHCTLPPFSGYSEWKTERGGTDKGGGGLCILYREGLTPHQWSPLVPPELKYIMNERQWLLLDSGKERLAVLHVYIACQSHKSDGFLQWNEDLFTLLSQEAVKLRQQGFIILALGDFNSRVGRIPGLENNTPDINRNTPMFLNFISQVNFTIINTLPISKGLFTRFMDSSGRPGTQSLLDYGLIDSDHVHTVTSFVIDEEARYDCATDHALLLCHLEFGSKPSANWSFHEVIKYDFNEKSDFSEYQKMLDHFCSSTPLHQFENLPADQMLTHITHCINESGKKSFGLKVKKRKHGQKLPRHITDKLKPKQVLSRNLHHARLQHNPNVETLQADLNLMKAEIKDLISEVKLKRRLRLRTKLLQADPSRKKFWRFLKNQMKAAGSITGAYDKAGNMIFQQDEIEEAVLDHFGKFFQGQRIPVFTDPEPLDQVALTIQELDNILGKSHINLPDDKFEEQVCSPYSFTELNQILATLPSGKASGYDQVPSEFLKHSSFKFKQYLLTFLNQIIKDGKVPEELNLGKCMLIYKVRIVNITLIIISLYKITHRVEIPCLPHNIAPLPSHQTS